jgi:hypothetical protein
MIARCTTCGELFETTRLPTCGHVRRRGDKLDCAAPVWEAKRFKEPARRALVTMEMYLQEEDWDKLEDGARLLYSAMLTRPRDRIANSGLANSRPPART